MFPSNGSQTYRSPRAVKPSNQGGSAVSKRSIYLMIGIVILGIVTLTPIIFIERSMSEMENNSGGIGADDGDDDFNDLDAGSGGGVNDLLRTSVDIMKKRSHSGLARGVAGLPIEETPAIIDAKEAKLSCGSDVKESMKIKPYWNDPQGKRDREFVSPFKGTDKTVEQFLTFETDQGGWNNIRMSFENIMVFAAATGRTLVLPPKSEISYLSPNQEPRGVGDFYNLKNEELLKRVKIISMEEFLEKHGAELLSDYSSKKIRYNKASKECIKATNNSPNSCSNLFEDLRATGAKPKVDVEQNCFIFDQDMVKGGEASDETHLKIDRFCGTDRKPVFYNKEMQNQKWIHWDASQKKNHLRLFQHFYTFMYFTNEAIDNHYKRFVRDFIHYNDEIYCAASKVVHEIKEEAHERKLTWSALHVRRGDFQYQKVLIPANEWYNNTKEVWKPKEILYMATDEENADFFQPFRDEGHTVRFLKDYKDKAGLGSLDPMYYGVIDSIVASRARAFAGTWFSTMSSYINRLRGYSGKSMKDSWYGFKLRKESMREWLYPEGNYPAREWPIAWVGIDGDELMEHERIIEVPLIHRKKMPVTRDQLVADKGFSDMPVARGIAGRKIDITPSVVGAKRGHIQCDINVDSMAYWNDPVGSADLEFKPPFGVSEKEHEKYLSFSSDRGGWNNVRMEFEVMYLLAAVLGRTLVLPPKETHYLLDDDPKNLYRGIADFFPVFSESAMKRVKTITFEEFINKEGGRDGKLPIPDHLIEKVLGAAEFCSNDKKSPHACLPMLQYLEEVGHLPNVKASDACILFDKDYYNDIEISDQLEELVLSITGYRRQAYFDKVSQEPTLMHFRGHRRDYRVRANFYGFVVFTDPKIDNYYKRLIRDTLHYNDEIFCAAGKIVKALQAEYKMRGDDGIGVDPEIGSGGFSSLHVRNGKDFPHPKIQIPAVEWYENAFEIWEPNEILFIATDEKNRTWFNDLAVHHQIRFIEDYTEIAGLDTIDPDYYSMIEAIVASRGRTFTGTWFSTFSAYITRLRGYYGMTQKDTWYPWLDRKDAMHTWKTPSIFEFGHEWPDAWIGIDADVKPYTEKEKKKSAIF